MSFWLVQNQILESPDPGRGPQNDPLGQLYTPNSMRYKFQQKGQVILIALLIMAVVLVVALAIGTLMVKELKMAANIDRSVTAYFAAESGLESALWEVRKNNVDPKDLDDPPYNQGTVLEGKGTWELSLGSYSEQFDPQSLEADRSDQVFIPANSINSIKFTNLVFGPRKNPGTSRQFQYRLIRWPSDTFDPSQISTAEHLIPDNVTEANVTDFLPSYNQVLRFKPLNCDITYLLECDPDPPGCEPLSKKILVISKGDYQKIRRNISVVFYPTPPLHGIFDYVLFSDESIIK